jgi:ribosome-binding factor A
MSVVTVEKVTLQNDGLSARIDELGAELAATKEFGALFDEYLQLQKKINIAVNSKRTEQLLFRLDGVIDQELALVERFFYMAGFNEAMKKT